MAFSYSRYKTEIVENYYFLEADSIIYDFNAIHKFMMYNLIMDFQYI